MYFETALKKSGIFFGSARQALGLPSAFFRQ
jgi:hypothetical protein